MHGCWKWNYPSKSSTVLYILECLLYLSVSTATLRLYRINHKEIKLIGYCVVFIVIDMSTFMPGCGGNVASGLKWFFRFFSNTTTLHILRGESPIIISGM